MKTANITEENYTQLLNSFKMHQIVTVTNIGDIKEGDQIQLRYKTENPTETKIVDRIVKKVYNQLSRLRVRRVNS